MSARIAALVLACAVFPAIGADADPVPTPEGWRRESFTFPLQFAPSIPYEGKEHVRFTPSWSRFDEVNGFSYVILWDLKAKPVAPDDIEEYLEAYFNGLMTNVGRQRKLSDKETKAVTAVHPMTSLPGWAQGYGVEVRTWNPFSKGEPLLLYGEIGQRECGERMQFFFAFSKATRDRPIWKGLRAARDATSCDKTGS